MENKSGFLKILAIVCLTILISYSAFYIKTRVNNDNLQNKNYLATSIRNRNTPFKELQGTNINKALSYEEFIHYSKELFTHSKSKNSTDTKVYFLKDLTNYIDQPVHPADIGKLATVSLVISPKQQVLHTKREYLITEQNVPEHFFKTNNTFDVNLKENHLTYTLVLEDSYASPNCFINYLPLYASQIEKNFSIPSIVSEITIQAKNAKYKYYSNLPMYLIEYKNLG